MIAELAEQCARQRLWDLPGPSLSGAGWYAVRTGALSNDLNGVVSDGTIPAADRERLLGWLDGVPASWQTTRVDLELTEALLAAGAKPERDGHWCGRAVDVLQPTSLATRADDPRAWSTVLDACGWYDGDLPLRLSLLEQLFASEQWGHWWVVDEGEVVGALSAWCGPALEVVDVAVVPSHRRRGLGAALVDTAMVWGRERGVGHAVAAPSPEGAALFGSLGFGFEPVTPDVCFYLSG